MKHVSVWDFGVSHIFPELFVFVSSDFSLLARPDSSEGVDNLSVKLDGERNELREFLDCLFDQCLLRKLSAGG
jgi:hypothetical protein